jgi:hypothetical protein
MQFRSHSILPLTCMHVITVQSHRCVYAYNSNSIQQQRTTRHLRILSARECAHLIHTRQSSSLKCRPNFSGSRLGECQAAKCALDLREGRDGQEVREERGEKQRNRKSACERQRPQVRA